MTVLKATIRVLILLAWISLVSPYPVARPQTAENKGRGRSYPLIISHYSSVRNSKYDSPPATEAPTTPAAATSESTDLEEKVDDERKASTSLVNTDEIKPAGDESNKQKVQEESKDDDAAAAAAAPNMAAADSASVSRNESIPATTAAPTPEDSLLVSKAPEEVQSLEVAVEKVVQEEEPKVGSESSDATAEDSASTGATNTKEEVPTTSLVEADKPAALGESDKAAATTTTTTSVVLDEIKTPEMDAAKATESVAADVAKEESADKIVAEETVKPSNDEVKASGDENVKVAEPAAVPSDQVKVAEATQDEVKAEPAVESSRTGSLATEKEKTSEFFEEDRSFKDRPDPELFLAAIRSGAVALGVGEEPKTLPAQIDDIANEGVRLEREDNKKMTEKKEKEKEKYLLAKPSKEKKPTKPIQSNDPVQEYDDVITRGGKSKDDSESTTDTTAVVDKALTPEEPITLTLVPDNYPVILPSGESTLSDKVKPEDLETKTVEEPITISLVPSNYPVILPSGESTLSDQVKPEDLKSSSTSEQPVTVSAVPTNYPVVLPSGESTLSDKVKTEVSESPKEVKTGEK